jgi:hypothetical protein
MSAKPKNAQPDFEPTQSLKSPEQQMAELIALLKARFDPNGQSDAPDDIWLVVFAQIQTKLRKLGYLPIITKSLAYDYSQTDNGKGTIIYSGKIFPKQSLYPRTSEDAAFLESLMPYKDITIPASIMATIKEREIMAKKIWLQSITDLNIGNPSTPETPAPNLQDVLKNVQATLRQTDAPVINLGDVQKSARHQKTDAPIINPDAINSEFFGPPRPDHLQRQRIVMDDIPDREVYRGNMNQFPGEFDEPIDSDYQGPHRTADTSGNLLTAIRGGARYLMAVFGRLRGPWRPAANSDFGPTTPGQPTTQSPVPVSETNDITVDQNDAPERIQTPTHKWRSRAIERVRAAKQTAEHMGTRALTAIFKAEAGTETGFDSVLKKAGSGWTGLGMGVLMGANIASGGTLTIAVGAVGVGLATLKKINHVRQDKIFQKTWNEKGLRAAFSQVAKTEAKSYLGHAAFGIAATSAGALVGAHLGDIKDSLTTAFNAVSPYGQKILDFIKDLGSNEAAERAKELALKAQEQAAQIAEEARKTAEALELKERAARLAQATRMAEAREAIRAKAEAARIKAEEIRARANEKLRRETESITDRLNRESKIEITREPIFDINTSNITPDATSATSAMAPNTDAPLTGNNIAAAYLAQIEETERLKQEAAARALGLPPNTNDAQLVASL